MTAQLVDSLLVSELDSDLAIANPRVTVAVTTPFTGELLHDLPQGTAQDVADAAAAARVAQRSWVRMGFAARERILLAAHDILVRDRESIMDVLQSETGKPRGNALEEVVEGLGVTRYYAVAARGILRTNRRRGGIPLVTSARVTYRSKGLVGVITPWNYPLALSLLDVIPALAAGNGVVQKADNQGALTVLHSRRAFIEAGVPAALWAVVTGEGGEIGNAVVDAVDYVCFTGSTKTGTAVAVRAAGRLIGASLELGGKNPMIILDDVDPRKVAAQAAFGCFSSTGQLCVSIERIYVHRAVADRFIPEFVAATEALVMGVGFDGSTDVGSLTNAHQLEHVKEHVDDALAKGATLLTGGRARPDLGPLFFEPTVLTDVTSEMACSTGETFGPVVAIEIVDSEEQAIARANDSEFGLNASVFSGSVRRGRRVAEQIEAGSVNVNEGYRASFSSIDAPMGGMKHSGLGRRNGPEGLMRFVESRTVAESTGLLTLPRNGREWTRLSGILLTTFVALRVIRRR